MGIIMGTFDLFGIIESIIDPTSSYKEMQDKIESNKEESIKDCHPEVESVEPEQDFNGLKTDIMNDFDDDSDTEDGNAIITEDIR